MATSPVPAVEAVVPVLAVLAVVAVVVAVLVLLLPQAARTKAPKLAAPALPAIFRKRLRSRSSRTRRSTIPAGCGADSSVGGLDILLPPLRNVQAGPLRLPPWICHVGLTATTRLLMVLFAQRAERDHSCGILN